MSRTAPWLALALAACAPVAAPPPPPPVDDSIARAACAAPPPSSLTAGAPETTGDYDAALSALDLQALPAQIDLAPLSALAHDLVAYMLAVPPLDLHTVDRDLARGTPLGDAVLGAFAQGTGGDVDFAFLRQGLYARYACGRAQPLALADLLTGLVVEETEVLDISSPKHLPRRLTHGVVAGADAYIAETLTDGDVVRETEILLEGRADGAFDFLSYDASGALQRSDTFASSSGADVVGPVPFTCMACHRDVDTGTGFTVTVPP